LTKRHRPDNIHYSPAAAFAGNNEERRNLQLRVGSAELRGRWRPRTHEVLSLETGAAAMARKRTKKKRFARKDLLTFRKLLLKRRAELAGTFESVKEQALDGIARKNGDLSTVPSEEAEIATHIFDQNLSLALLQSEAATISEIDEAIRRIDEGSYGTCEACGRPIPKARLRVLPFAKLCVKCREAQERGDLAGL